MHNICILALPVQCDAAVAGQVPSFRRILRQPPSRLSLAREADVACPRIFRRPWVMKPSPGENKFGDPGESCGMRGLRFSASPDGNRWPSLWPPRGALVTLMLAAAALLPSFLHRIVGRLAQPGNDATAVSRTGEADSSSMIRWFARSTCVCGSSQVSILSAQSPQTASSSSLECAIHAAAVWAPPLGHGCA